MNFLKKFNHFRWLLMMVFLLALSPVWAGYQLDPIRLEVHIPPGKTLGTASLKITNTDLTSIRLKVYLNDWSVDPQGGLHLSEAPLPGSLMDKVRMNPQEFEVAPGESQTIRLAVSIPDKEEPGEAHTMVMLEDMKTVSQHLEFKQGPKTSIDIKKRLGVAMYVYHGKPKPAPEIQAFNCEIVNGELVGHVQIQNAGYMHTHLATSLVLMPKSDTHHKDIVEIPPGSLQNIFILPKESFKNDVVLMNAEQLRKIPSGNYQVKLHLLSVNQHLPHPLKAESDVEIKSAPTVNLP